MRSGATKLEKADQLGDVFPPNLTPAHALETYPRHRPATHQTSQ